LDPAYFLDRRFQRVEDWPLTLAARVPPQVRIAYIANIPDRFRELVLVSREARSGTARPTVALAGTAPALAPAASAPPPAVKVVPTPEPAVRPVDLVEEVIAAPVV